jgi:hypothetical protein
MRIIYLNCWFGKVEQALFEFVKTHATDTDIFCFQEVSPELFTGLEKVLPSHKGVYGTDGIVDSLGLVYGEVIFVKNSFPILSSAKIDIYEQVPDDIGFLQLLRIKADLGELSLGNLHGMARPGTKLDTPERLKQSEIIIDSFKKTKGLKIFGGDFNLLPDTKSILLLEEKGYRNLIKEYGIKNTRNRLTWEKYSNQEKQYFADYVFVSPEVKLKGFSVPNIEISDHLPLILEFEL